MLKGESSTHIFSHTSQSASCTAVSSQLHMWWLTGPQSLCQMFIRNLSLRFSLRPQPCLSAYKCAALLSQQPTQQHSLPFAQALGSELKCVCVLSKRPAACFISLWVPDHAIGHPTEILFSLYLSLTLQGTSISYTYKSITGCSWFQAIETLLPPSLFLSLSVKNKKPQYCCQMRTSCPA